MASRPAGLTPAPDWSAAPGEADGAIGPEPAATGLLEGLEQAAALQPVAIAMQDETLALSFGNLLGSLGALAAAIAEAGTAGSAVALVCGDPTWQLVALLACFATGRTALPFDPGLVAGLLGKARPGAVVGGPHEAAGPSGLPWVAAGRVHAAASGRHWPAPAPGFPALVLPGGPGGIALDQAGLLRFVRLLAMAAGLGPADRVLLLHRLDRIEGIGAALATLLQGAALQLADVARHGVAGLPDRLRQGGVTVLCTTPWMLRALLRAAAAAGGPGDAAFATLRLVRLEGGPLHWRDVAALRQRLPAGARIQFGCALGGALVAQWEIPDTAPPDHGWVPAGRLRRDLRFATGPGGELLLQGEALPPGAWPEDGGDAPRWFATGQPGRVRPDGLLDMSGSLPDAVEAALRDLPEVADAAVLRLPGADGEVVGFACLRPGVAATAAALTARLGPARPAAGLHLLSELPLLADAMPDLEALARHHAAAGGPAAPPAAAGTAVDAALAGAWRSVLDRASLREDLPFEAAGGDSLKLLQLAMEVERRLGAADLPLDALQPGMRPSEMQRALATWLGPKPAVADRQGPVMLFLPGLNGDEPALARLRAELPSTLPILVGRYPGWAEMLRPGFGFGDITEAALAAIPAGLSGPVHLVGYSFGGHVAFAAAARLLARGAAVGSVCLIDTSREGLAPMAAGPALRSVIFAGALRNSLGERRPEEAIGMLIGENLARPALRPVLRGLARFGKLPGLGVQVGFHSQMYLEALMRAAMLREWLATAPQPPLREVPGTLLVSDQHAAPGPGQLGWLAACPGLRVRHVAGSHHSIFNDRNRPDLRAAILQACGFDDAAMVASPVAPPVAAGMPTAA